MGLPPDPENYLFLGTLAFSEADQVDPAKTIQDSLSSGKASVAKCCSPLATCVAALSFFGSGCCIAFRGRFVFAMSNVLRSAFFAFFL